MNISISTYHIKQGDTLASVAEELGVAVDELRKYHNTYCDIKNLIGYDLKGFHEILIPPLNVITELKEKKHIQVKDGELPAYYLSKNFYAKEYQVKEKFEKSLTEDLEVDYLFHIALRETANEGFIAETYCSGFKKQNETMDDKISSLSIACMNSISPIAFTVLAQGKIKGLYNHKDIIQKFLSKKQDIEDFFVGEISKKYINKFQENIGDENFLLKQFSATLLYQTVFPKMDWFHKKTSWEEEWYIVQNSFPVKFRFEAEYNHEDNEFIETIIHGNMQDIYSVQELLRGIKFKEKVDNPASVEIELRYKTHKVTRRFSKGEASVTIWHEEEIYSRQIMTVKEVKN